MFSGVMQPIRQKIDDENVVYITNIPIGTAQCEMEDIMKNYGDVVNVYIKDVASQMYRFSFVTFANRASAEKIVKKETIEINGRKCFVKARNNTPSKYNVSSTNNITPHNTRVLQNKDQSNEEYNDTVIRNESVPKRDVLCFNKVVRFDGIPCTWNAENLFNHLVLNGFNVVATLIYNDSDQYGLCAGLIEFDDLENAQIYCGMTIINTPELKLSVVRSVLQSINMVRTTYKGSYTCYEFNCQENSNEDVTNVQATEPCDTYGYSVAEPYEPNINFQVSSIAFKSSNLYDIPEDKANYIRQWDVSPGSEYSDNLDRDTPNGIESVTPLSDVSEGDFKHDHSNCDHTIPNYATARESIVEPPMVETEIGGLLTGKGVFDSYCSKNNNVSPLLPDPCCIMEYQRSATIVIDNMKKSFTSDALSLAMWMRQFGDVRTTDLVSVSNDYYRAYVSYWNPINANLAHYNLMTGDLSDFHFQVRMA